MLADGMAYLVDESRAHQLRQVGNGVVPLQAAVALVVLVRRAGGY
jgi:DNA (cytosine-5)-methyltransferase 1